MTYLAIPSTLGEGLRAELLSASPLEAGAFCLLQSLDYDGASRLVLSDPIASQEPWSAQRHDLLTPSGRRISAAISSAKTAGCGLAFIHSHPKAPNARLSQLDLETTQRLAGITDDLLDGPFASLVVAPTAWGGVVADRGRLSAIERIAVVGRQIVLHGGRRGRIHRALDDRQIRAMGKSAQRLIRSARVGVVGAGGLGAPITETLVRMGLGEVRLVDNDVLDSVSNARRIFGVSRTDTESSPPRPKAEVVARSLNSLGLGTRVIPVVGDVRERETQSRLLDVDVLIGGTDTHSSRAALTELAARGSIPLVDVGVRVGVRAGSQLDSLRLERRVQVPDGPCLWCWGVLSSERVRTETLPPDQRRQLIDEGYIAGVAGDPAPSVAALTVTAAGAATSAVLAMFSGAFDVAPLAVGMDAVTLDSSPLARDVPDPQCVCSRWRSASN